MTQPTSWIVRSRLDKLLPAHVKLTEDEDLTYLSCTGCGFRWVFNAPIATPAVLLATAREHRCVQSYRHEYGNGGAKL